MSRAENLARLTLIRGMRAQAEDAMRLQTAKVLKMQAHGIDDLSTVHEILQMESSFCDQMVENWKGIKEMIESLRHE